MILSLCFLFAISAGVVSYLQNSGLLPLSSMLEDARKLFLQSELIDNPSLPIKSQDRVSVWKIKTISFHYCPEKLLKIQIK